MFDRVCSFKVKTEIDLEELELNFIDFGVDEVIEDEDGVLLFSSFENYGAIQKELEKQEIEIISSEFERIPKQNKELDDDGFSYFKSCIFFMHDGRSVKNKTSNFISFTWNYFGTCFLFFFT